MPYLFDCEDCHARITDETEIGNIAAELGSVVYCPSCFRIYGKGIPSIPFGLDTGEKLAVYYDTTAKNPREIFIITERGKFNQLRTN